MVEIYTEVNFIKHTLNFIKHFLNYVPQNHFFSLHSIYFCYFADQPESDRERERSVATFRKIKKTYYELYAILLAFDKNFLLIEI